MSSANLKKFLEKLDAELKRPGASDDYRRAVGNKKTHIFTYKSSTIRFVLRDLLNRSTGSGPEGREAYRAIAKDLKPLVAKLTKTIRTNFKRRAQISPDIKYKEIPGGAEVVVLKYEKTSRDNYTLITKEYKEALDKFYQDFLNLLDKPITRPSQSKKGVIREVSTAGEAFNLEHIQGSNIEAFLNDTIHKVLKETYTDSKPSAALKKELKKFDGETILSFMKNAEIGEINVTIRSQVLNAIAGGGAEKALAKKLREAVEKLRAQDLSGSDSLAEGQRKKAVKKLVTPFKNKTNVKVKHESTKVKGAKSSATLRKKPKTSKLVRTAPALARKKRITNKQEPEEKRSLFSVMAMINQKLPQTVEKNMRSPGLENRTGRFARSVRLTDVSETRQGFPSFGYTYRTDPYAVFEVGRGRAPWATPERDPRKVIDASIRELAAQMALGRFYTRRV